MRRVETRQRRAIRTALERAGRPLGAREVLAAAQAEVPRLGLATVYRTLRALAGAGAVTAVVLPGEAPRFEVRRRAHHHHFVCRTCGGVFEVEGCVGDPARLTPRGFALHAHEIILYGACAACVGRTRREKGAGRGPSVVRLRRSGS